MTRVDRRLVRSHSMTHEVSHHYEWAHNLKETETEIDSGPIRDVHLRVSHSMIPIKELCRVHRVSGFIGDIILWTCGKREAYEFSIHFPHVSFSFM